MSEDLRPPTPAHLTTLRIKSENGDQVSFKIRPHDCHVIIYLIRLQMYILKMKYHDSIEDVRQHIDRLRSGISDGRSEINNININTLWLCLPPLRPAGSPQTYVLKSSFPPRMFTESSTTLEDCGLIPTANLFMCQSNK